MTDAAGKRRRPPFAMVPEALLDADVSDRAVRLYGLLDRYLGENARAWPARATMAERLRCSVDSVDRAVAELRDAGYLELESGKAAGTTSSYTLHDRPRLSTACRTGAAPPCRTGAVPGAAPVRHKGESGNERTPNPAGEAGRAPGSRASGTNPRALGTNPRAARPPELAAAEATVAAARTRAELDAARQRGELCTSCGGEGWLPQQIGDDDVVLDRCDTCEATGVRLIA